MWLASLVFVSSFWVLISQIFDFNPLIIFSLFNFLFEMFNIDGGKFVGGMFVLIGFYSFVNIMDKILDKKDKKDKK